MNPDSTGMWSTMKKNLLLGTIKNKVTKMNNGTCILTAVGLVCSVFAVVFFITPPAF